MNRAAGDIIQSTPKINSLQAIMRLRPKVGSEWSTIAFVLNRDMIKPDGTLDELHGIVFPLGSFHSQELAEEHAKNVIAMTGHPAVVAARYGAPVKLTTKFDPNTVVDVNIDTKGRLIQMESSQYKHENEEYERRLKIERDIMKEAEEETDHDSIEHFKRQCYLAIKNRSNYQMHNKEADTAWANYKKREMAVRDHYRRHPEHETEWLRYLKEKLRERGEINLYKALKNAYKELREELLGLAESGDEGSVETNPTQPDTIECECPGSVCLGLKSQEKEECPGGVCMARKTDEDDELISAEEVSQETVQDTTVSQTENTNFVEEELSPKEVIPPQRTQSNRKGRNKKKRGARNKV